MIISPYCYCSDLDDASFIYVLTTVILFHNIILLHGICWPCVHVCNTLLDKARLQGELRDTNLSVWSSKTVPSFSFIILFVIRQIISSWVGWSFINSVATKEWPSRQRKTSVEKKSKSAKQIRHCLRPWGVQYIDKKFPNFHDDEFIHWWISRWSKTVASGGTVKQGSGWTCTCMAASA